MANHRKYTPEQVILNKKLAGKSAIQLQWSTKLALLDFKEKTGVPMSATVAWLVENHLHEYWPKGVNRDIVGLSEGGDREPAKKG